MDPFLEAADVFPDLHDSLIIHIKEALVPKLPHPYYAVAGSRVWMEPASRPLGPDVRIHRKNGPKNGRKARKDSGTAVLSVERPKPVVVTIPYEEFRETFVEIHAKQSSGKRFVTSIEILSPTNKRPGEYGCDAFMRKQRELTAKKVHLVEIDLLRGGRHTTSVPRDDAVAKAGAFDYHVCCRRFDQLEDYFVYPIQLEDPLPAIAIPLLPGDADVEIALQPLMDQVYDAGAFPRYVEYDKEVPRPSLEPSRAKWVKKRLAEAGILKRR
jgi:hypothetical protein